MSQEVDLTDLHKVAGRVPDTAWKANPGDLGSWNIWSVTSGMHTPFVATATDEAHAKFIATFDPPTVIALLARLEQAEQAVARVREKHAERVLVYPNGAEEHYCADDENSAWPCDTILALDGDGRG